MEQTKFDKFVEIIKKLRAPDGCPWDREQTLTSMKKCILDESAETLVAIDIYEKTGDTENLCEELGDMLLQVVMHAVIAEEEGLFTMDDVIEMVSEKMVRRHPHVFGDVDVANSAEVLKNWEKIKKKEHSNETICMPSKKEIIQNIINEGEKRLNEIG